MTYTVIGLLPLLRWHRMDDGFSGDACRTVNIPFQRHMNVDILPLHLVNWDAAHGNPLRLARGPDPCFRYSCVVVGRHWKGVVIRIRDSDCA